MSSAGPPASFAGGWKWGRGGSIMAVCGLASPPILRSIALVAVGAVLDLLAGGLRVFADASHGVAAREGGEESDAHEGADDAFHGIASEWDKGVLELPHARRWAHLPKSGKNPAACRLPPTAIPRAIRPCGRPGRGAPR